MMGNSEPVRRVVMFDFDGVVADTLSLTHERAREVCAKLADLERYRLLFEGNVYDAYGPLYAEDGHTDACRHEEDWFAGYREIFKQRARPFAGVLQALRTIASRCDFILLTSTERPLAEHFLKKYDSPPFLDILGKEAHLSKVEKFRTASGTHDFVLEESLYVGDTLGDIREAREAGVPVIAVTWGFHDRATLERGNPVATVERPEDLAAAIKRHFERV